MLQVRWLPGSMGTAAAIRKEATCFQGATVTAVRGRAFVVVKPWPRKTVTVAPKANISGKWQQIDFRTASQIT